MACVIARIWASVNEPRKGEPRCPLVPNTTSCSASSRSGRRAKYSRSRWARSTSISLDAGLPAKGEMVMARTSSRHRTRVRIPDLGGILGNRAVARKFAGAGNIYDGLARPSVGVGVQLSQPVVRLEVGFTVCQVHVVVSVGQQRITYRSEDAGLVAAEIIGEDQIQRGPSLGLVVVMPLRIVPTTAPFHLLRRQPE